ncbi:MAG: hypothetical protein COA73_13570 [Candidatus Hydrogenedentota bacterium]|nr:MAG: hypothetical protein COA73_13570 [Candidatus Hydrogenedentota bacterium]
MLPTSKIITDSIHGDIHLSELEHKVIDTASFQRLRRIKQLSMGQLTYPNATHSRFAHSLGVLKIMTKVIDATKNNGALNLSDIQEQDLRLAALLHDIGHYPYSHLMEKVDHVKLTEDIIEIKEKRTVDASHTKYPNHEDFGKIIVNKQPDILELQECHMVKST